MMKRIWRQGLRYSIGAAAAVAMCAPTAAQAQITRVSSGSSDHRQAVGVTFGGFLLKGEDSRVDGDVLFNDLDSLLFDIKDFNGPAISGEWLVGLGDFLEAGVSAGYYQQAVPSVYRSQVNDNGTEIEQELKLRVVPLTATVRFLPIGHASVEPYIGAGIGAFRWRYSRPATSWTSPTARSSGIATSPTAPRTVPSLSAASGSRSPMCGTSAANCGTSGPKATPSPPNPVCSAARSTWAG